MSGAPKLREILSEIQVTTARTDERLQIVIDEAKETKHDVGLLKTQRSWIAGAYFALVAAFTTYWSTKK